MRLRMSGGSFPLKEHDSRRKEVHAINGIRGRKGMRKRLFVYQLIRL